MKNNALRDSAPVPADTSLQAARTETMRDSFIRAIGRSMRSVRLGDMLVAAGMLTTAQLHSALAQQKETGEQLGKILVREKYISAVQLYGKLAEQWCIKASTAGVALFIQTVSPSTARADDAAGAQVRLAAAFAPAAIKPSAMPVQTPRLFGTTEVRSTDITSFTKWTSVMKRFEDQMSVQATSPRVQVWKAQIRDLQHKSTVEKIRGVNDYINQVRYVEDQQNYGKSDYWATPIEFFSKGGDCEDFAVAKYASLRALGFSSEQLRIAIVQDKVKNIAHAILVVYTEEGTYVLDNQDKNMRQVESVNRYQPIFSINSSNWWLHRTSGANS